MHIRSISVALGLVAVVVLTLLFAGLGQNTASGTGSGPFGDGSDGPKTYSSNETDAPKDAVVDSGMASSTTLVVSSVGSAFVGGEIILIHQTRGTGAGSWELNEVQAFALGNITTVTPLANSYMSDGGSRRAQVLVVPQYSALTVNNGVTVTAKSWNGTTGGIFAALVDGTATVTGTISASEAGFRGGQAVGNNTNAYTGEGNSGASFQCTCGSGFGNAGLGDSNFTAASGAGGGGGGHGTGGGQGWAGVGQAGPQGGNTSGSADLLTATFGGGAAGGSGGNTGPSGSGGSAGGFIYLAASTLTLSGSLEADGGNGTNGSGNSAAGGGGGAGGSILIRIDVGSLTGGTLAARGGDGGANSTNPGNGGTGSDDSLDGDTGLPNGGGGGGGAGRIAAEYCTSLTGGSSLPAATVSQIACKTPPTPTNTPTVTPPPPQPEINISGFGQYVLPKSCYEVRDDVQAVLFEVCDNDFAGPAEIHAACNDGNDNICNDEDTDPGSVKVTVAADTYNVTVSDVPTNHTADPAKENCVLVTKCTLTFTSTSEARPWNPWDINLDGVVDLPNDILDVILHFCPLVSDPCAKP